MAKIFKVTYDIDKDDVCCFLRSLADRLEKQDCTIKRMEVIDKNPTMAVPGPDGCMVTTPTGLNIVGFGIVFEGATNYDWGNGRKT